MIYRWLLFFIASWLPMVTMAGIFSFPPAGVRLMLEDGFSVLSGSEAAKFYRPGWAPSFMVGNVSRTVTVSIDLKNYDLSNLSLPQVLPIFQQVFQKRVPSLVWKSRSVIEKDRREIIQLEFLSKFNEVEFYNIIWISGIDNRMQVLNFSATVGEFSAVEQKLRAAMMATRLDAFTPVAIRPATGVSASVKAIK